MSTLQKLMDKQRIEACRRVLYPEQQETQEETDEDEEERAKTAHALFASVADMDPFHLGITDRSSPLEPVYQQGLGATDAVKMEDETQLINPLSGCPPTHLSSFLPDISEQGNGTQTLNAPSPYRPAPRSKARPAPTHPNGLRPEPPSREADAAPPYSIWPTL